MSRLLKKINSLPYQYSLYFKPQIIGNHREKLAVCGLTSIILNGISEIRVKRIHVASVPCDLDGMADGTLDSVCGRLVFLRNRW